MLYGRRDTKEGCLVPEYQIYTKPKACCNRVQMCFLQTCSKKCKDTLIYFASLKRVPVTPVLLTRSELQQEDEMKTVIEFFPICKIKQK